MLQNNSLLAQLKQQLHQQTPRVEGVVRANPKGFGFLDVDNKTNYFIPTNHMKKLLNGDKVSGKIISNNGKESFEPESLMTSALDVFLGQISYENNMMIIEPENHPQIKIRCKVIVPIANRLKAGDWVKAKLVSHPLNQEKRPFFADIIEFIAEEKSPYQLWLKTLARHDLELSSIIDSHSWQLQDDENLNRLDLTDQCFFTIDGAETQDMDDAIHITKNAQGNFELSVAIADPTAYLTEESEVDLAAKNRQFSTYLPSFTLPMLPKSLANELCSLKANEKRPAIVCQITLDPEGYLLPTATFCAAWIESKAKLSYQNVSDYLNNQAPLLTDVPSIAEQLQILAQFTEIRTHWRKTNALMFKDNIEYRFIFDEHRQLINITQEPRLKATYLIEEAMVAANQAFTNKIQQEAGFAIFSIHNGFDIKFADLIEKILAENQLNDYNKETILTFDGYKQLRHHIADNDVLEYRLRRYQSLADFSIEPKPHFGLGFSAYATWTSPIRKYGDIVNHRILKALLTNQAPTRPQNDIIQTMNLRRKALRLADRDISEKLYAQYLSTRTNEQYQAEIIDINRGGAKVRLLDNGAIAFLPMSLIHSQRNEISAHPEEGAIKINGEVAFKLLDQLAVTINDIKTDCTIIAKKA